MTSASATLDKGVKVQTDADGERGCELMRKPILVVIATVVTHVLWGQEVKRSP
jgi:hypothetical protein